MIHNDRLKNIKSCIQHFISYQILHAYTPTVSTDKYVNIQYILNNAQTLHMSAGKHITHNTTFVHFPLCTQGQHASESISYNTTSEIISPETAFDHFTLHTTTTRK
jgi:hypothetical protein